MSIDEVFLAVGGRQWTGIQDLEVDAAFDHAVICFRLVLAPAPELLQIFAPGSAIDILFGGDLACRGYVDRLQPSYVRLEVSGRSRAQDFADCAAIDKQGTGNFQNQTLLQIAQSLDQFGVGVSTDQQLGAIERYQIAPGETCFGAIGKLAREQGLTLCGQPDGSISITKPGTMRHAGGLFDGVNILSRGACADLNWAHRHSHVLVRGQSAIGTEETDLGVEATAEDSSVGRYRPSVSIEDGDLDGPSAQALADARSQREAGESLCAIIPTPGFRDAAGVVWRPGNLVWVESPMLGLMQAMLIRRAVFTKSRRRGTVTHLHLVDPRAFGGTAAKGSKGNDVWDVGAPALPAAPAGILG